MCGCKIYKMSKRFFKRILGFVPTPTFKGKDNFIREYNFIKELGMDKSILNVGSGAKNLGRAVINLDIYPFENVNIIAKAEEMPFKDESFDGVIFNGVIQHVDKPKEAVRLMYRILKKGGQIYAEVPFMTPFIKDYYTQPNDFQRYTLSGVEQLFSDFRTINKGVMGGPSSAFTWILKEYLAILLSFNNPFLYKLFFTVFSWVLLPIKYLDIFLENNRFAYKIASGFYYQGVKE